MSIDDSRVIKKESLDLYLRELAKEYKKIAGKNMKAEIILVGGSAIVESYGFRDMTTDIDAVINAATSFKEAINRVGDKYGLPNGWLNTDFKKTDSYSSKLLNYSVFYKTFYNILDVRIVTGEHLIAMKLRAFRQYKNDVSDIIGILAEHKKRGDGITRERVDKAVTELYGSWDGFSPEAENFIEDVLCRDDYEKIYDLVRQNEKDAREQLIDFQNKYPQALKAESVDVVLEKLRLKR